MPVLRKGFKSETNEKRIYVIPVNGLEVAVLEDIRRLPEWGRNYEYWPATFTDGTKTRVGPIPVMRCKVDAPHEELLQRINSMSVEMSERPEVGDILKNVQIVCDAPYNKDMW